MKVALKTLALLVGIHAMVFASQSYGGKTGGNIGGGTGCLKCISTSSLTTL